MIKEKINAYWQLMRFHRPVGIVLLLWPTLWALWLANHGMPPVRLLIIFILGVIVTRAAGCIANDYFDQPFDGQVARTRHRPLVSGRLTGHEALAALLVLGLIALCLVLLLNRACLLLSVLAAVIALVYPLMKRYTHFPQFVLGLAFAMPIPMAFVASTHSFPPLGWLLWGIGVIWPLMYDTAYAITDSADDAKLGLKSTALHFGRHSALFIGWLQIAFIGLWALLAYALKVPWFFWLALGLSALCCGYQQHLLKQQQPFKAFLNNQWLGGLLWLGLAVSIP